MKRLLLGGLLAASMLVMPAPASELPSSPALAASPWNGPIRLPWYGAEYYGKPVSCPGYGKYSRWRLSVAVRAGTDRFECGDRIELRSGKQSVVVTVTDRFAGDAPSWGVFDASARVACAKLNPPNLKPTKPGRYHHCYTRDGVTWRRVP